MCIQQSTFANYCLPRNKTLIRAMQTSLHTSKEVVLTREKKMHVSLRQNYPLHRYFQCTKADSQVGKLIVPFLPLLPEFVIHIVKLAFKEM